MTWLLSALQTLTVDAEKLPPLGIIPLGTGNDLARSLGWGPALTDNGDIARCRVKSGESTGVSSPPV